MDHPEITKLYKYRAFNEFSLRMLADKEMWLSKPEHFNDPFDCSLMPGSSKTTDDQTHQLCEIIRELYESEEAEKQISEIIQRSTSKPVQEVEDVSITKHMDDARNSGVFSLSEKNDSIFMWAHYADNHTGFCIEFERRKAKNNFLSHFMCRKVEYTREYPNLHRIIDLMDVNLFTKAKGWEYEAEWRLVTKIGNIALPLPAPITAIYFGLRADDESIKTVKGLLKDESIQLYLAKRKQGEFAIEFEEI
ncbi:hypothetical protein MA04_02493 [Alcanivorax balearicus MACL04]|uniref:DUF2971 domain-containing protein n=1 Tax=Alloalcanivorax balearicus MACL04 TaxID=1177182 RepID=A0ABT2R089_9GAMM|nr:DUF2971 domain-containing protein [Alloalcanivorax balearicus]MCU5783193.1 hypothetical protein [Alloalcanivorax balearicus MACL04]